MECVNRLLTNFCFLCWRKPNSCRQSLRYFNEIASQDRESRSARLYVAQQRARQRRDLCTPAWTFVSLHPRRRAFLPLDPDHVHGDQPCADWMRARALPPCTCTVEALPPRTPRQDFRVPTPTLGSL